MLSNLVEKQRAVVSSNFKVRSFFMGTNMFGLCVFSKAESSFATPSLKGFNLGRDGIVFACM